LAVEYHHIVSVRKRHTLSIYYPLAKGTSMNDITK